MCWVTILTDNGISLAYRQKTMFGSGTDAIQMLSAYALSAAGVLSIQINLSQVYHSTEILGRFYTY
jgi:hypothetical protein